MGHFDADDPASFEPGHLGEVQDPHPLFAALHRAGPTVASRAGYRIVHGYEASQEVLRDKRFGTGIIAEMFRQALPEGAARDELGHRINFLDPPDHPRVRRLVMRAFTPARVRAMRPWMEGKAEEILDGVAERVRHGPVDLRAELAHALPSLVISQMLGVPIADRDMLTDWTEAVTPLLNPNLDPSVMERALQASEKFAAYAAELVEDRRKRPGDDLLTAMLEQQDGEEVLSRQELLSLIVTLYSAGHRTTRDLFSNGLFVLLRSGDDYAAVASDPSRVPSTVREMLRYETPTLYVARVPGEAVEIAGEPVPAVTPTLILLGAANHDPRAYPDPDRFDIDRFVDGSDAPAPLSFAAGPHHCLGAALAQMEAEVMLAAVTRRWPRLELAGPMPQWWSSGPFRGLTHLHVTSRPGG